MEFLRFPLDNSDELFRKFSEIPGCIHRGENMEKFIFIKGTRENKVLLAAHADTYWDSHYGVINCQPQELSQTEGIIQNKNGGLGADDRAGCATLWLLRHLGYSLLITKIETGYTEPNYSSFTDIVTLCRDVCGVNLSIGYQNEHTENESLDVSAWKNTLSICRKWLSKDDLPRFFLS